MNFGIDLVRRGILSAEQLVAAMERQDSLRPSIAELALHRNKLTMKQVFQVFYQQAGSQDSFEQTARDMRLLTRRQIADLALSQAELTPSLADILIDMGFASREAIDSHFHTAHRAIANPKLSKRKQTNAIVVQDR
ncbi:MAG: hypothetical protein KDB27_23845 [Planctomycetales bacterium]|nr:hypothetical protein [Planctomycetales bacterium]